MNQLARRAFLRRVDLCDEWFSCLEHREFQHRPNCNLSRSLAVSKSAAFPHHSTPCVNVGNDASRQTVNHIRRLSELPLRCWPAPTRAARFASSQNKRALWKPARLEQTKVNLFPYCTRPRHRRTGQEFHRTPGRHISLQGPATRYADGVPQSIYQDSLTLRTLMLRFEAPTKAAVRGRNLGPPVARARGAALACMTARSAFPRPKSYQAASASL